MQPSSAIIHVSKTQIDSKVLDVLGDDLNIRQNFPFGSGVISSLRNAK